MRWRAIILAAALLALAAAPAPAAVTGGMTAGSGATTRAGATGGTTFSAGGATPKRAHRKRVRRAPKRSTRRPPKARPRPKPRTPVKRAPAVSPSGFRFPVRGPHSFGGPDARFGAARSNHIHQGQDIIAAEGLPVVAVTRGTIVQRAYQAGGAGNYLVLNGSDGRAYVYMHLRTGSLVVDRGQAVSAGQQLAQVGSTGDSSGPHLHFEIWVGGWYTAHGAPIDPLAYLKRWDASS